MVYKYTKMKHLFFLLLILAPFLKATAQTGIGTTTPNASAKLDVYATNKGFLPPRVSLSNIYDQSTIASPATGLLVYCKGDAGLTAGYYYWNGNAWATIATAGGSGSFASSYIRGSRNATQTIAVGGVVTFTNIDNTSGSDISLNTTTGRITLAPGNTYRIRGAVPNFSSGQRPSFIWYNETASSNIGAATFAYNPGDAASLGAFGAPAELVFTPNVSTVISFRLLSSLGSGSVTVGGNADFNSTGSYPWFDIQVISGNAPVTGQSVDFAIASLSANQSLSGVGNIQFNTLSGTGISLSSGGFNLIANKTYKLEAALGGTSGGYAYYAWVDNTNTVLPGGSIGVIMKAGSAFTDAPQDKAVVFYTPTTNTTVFLRVLNVSGGVVAYAPPAANNYSSTWATISQVGSSAFVNPWILSGNNVYSTSGNVGIGTNTPSTPLDVVGNVNVTGKITLTDPTGNIGTKAAAFVDAGTFVTLDNIKATVTSSGNRGLSIATVSGSFTAFVNGTYTVYSGGTNGSGSSIAVNTTPSASLLNWNFLGQGDTSTYIINDSTNKRIYRITLMIGGSYLSNLISIERLL